MTILDLCSTKTRARKSNYYYCDATTVSKSSVFKMFSVEQRTAGVFLLRVDLIHCARVAENSEICTNRRTLSSPLRNLTFHDSILG